MSKDISSPSAAMDALAAAVADALDGRAPELALAWQEALRGGARTRSLGPVGAPLAGHGLDLVRALAAAIADPQGAEAAERLDFELTPLVRFQRAQGHSSSELLNALGLLHQVALEAVQGELSARPEGVPSDAALRIAGRLDRAHRSMLETTLRLIDEDAAATREVRASLLGTFARAVTHELRNRVNAARLSLSVYRSSRNERRDELLLNLEESLKRMEETVADVFSVALAQCQELPAAGRMPLRQLVEQMQRDFQELAMASKVAVRVVEPVPHLLVDATRVQLALLNLLTDAVKRSDRAKLDRWVEIHARRGVEAGEWRIDVRDNGVAVVGRGEGAQVVGGTGGAGGEQPGSRPWAQPIGLALADEAVRQLGGRLWIESSVAGEGTTYTFTLPESAGELELAAPLES